MKVNFNDLFAKAMTAALDVPSVHPGNDSWQTAYDAGMESLMKGQASRQAVGIALSKLPNVTLGEQREAAVVAFNNVIDPVLEPHFAKAMTAALDVPSVHPGNDSWFNAYDAGMESLMKGYSVQTALNAAFSKLPNVTSGEQREVAFAAYASAFAASTGLPEHKPGIAERARNAIRKSAANPGPRGQSNEDPARKRGQF